jgi:hypothetical protein
MNAISKGNRGNDSAGVRGASMIATAADTNKTAETAAMAKEEKRKRPRRQRNGVGRDV